ncbi:MAG: hypothetical protein ACERKN_19190 [Velocimicrobium sp.]
MQIKLVFEKKYVIKNRYCYYSWDISKIPHLALAGSTGLGKTYLETLIIGRICKQMSDSEVTICDFKGDEAFLPLKNTSNKTKRIYFFEDCEEGFINFHNSFLERQKRTDLSRNIKLLVFDEWSGFLHFLEKKKAEEYKKKMFNLLMLGRSLNIHILLSFQRLDSEFFTSGSRDQLGLTIILGNPSKEVKKMLFNNCEEHLFENKSRGEGYLIINGMEIRDIIVPEYSNHDKVLEYINKGITNGILM